MTTRRAILYPMIKYIQFPFLTQELITTRPYMTHFLANERSSHAGYIRGENAVISSGPLCSALLTLRDSPHIPGTWQVYEYGTKQTNYCRAAFNGTSGTMSECSILARVPPPPNTRQCNSDKKKCH